MRQIKLNTQNEVQSAVNDALVALDQCDVPDDLRVAAFSFAAAAFLNKQVFFHESDQRAVVEPAMAIPQKRH